MPLFSWPMSQPRHFPFSPKFSVQVGLALIPILCSMFPHATSLSSPRLPSAFGRNFGTRKSEIPLIPAGAPSIRASTGWTICFVKSWSPEEMKIFVPSSRKLSPSRFAFVLTAARSEPACGSVRHIVPLHSPVYIFSR